jgi:hypothetical protein
VAYFLKKSKQKNRTYIAIYESFYDPAKKGTAHRCHKSLGSIETLKEKGIEDPIAHYQKVVDELNKNRKEESVKKISTKSPLIHLGYFPLKSIMEKLNIKHFIDYFKLITRFDSIFMIYYHLLFTQEALIPAVNIGHSMKCYLIFIKPIIFHTISY